jgi:hypothetical protein
MQGERMSNVTARDLDDSFDSLSMTVMRVKKERDLLHAALGAIPCPDCEHSLSKHADKYGCEYDRGDGYIGGAEFLQALGPCGCDLPKSDAEFVEAVELLRKLK